MKNKTLGLVIMLCVLGFSFASHTVRAEATGIEGAGEIFILKGIDRTKKVLTLADIKVAYSAATLFIDSHGNKKTIDDLALGQVVSYEYNYKARYYSMPTATVIRIML